MPTNVWYPHEQVVGLIAGGQQAILKAVENAEDDRSAGEQDLRNLALNEKDVVVGIAASGRTPMSSLASNMQITLAVSL